MLEHMVDIHVRCPLNLHVYIPHEFFLQKPRLGQIEHLPNNMH